MPDTFSIQEAFPNMQSTSPLPQPKEKEKGSDKSSNTFSMEEAFPQPGVSKGKQAVKEAVDVADFLLSAPAMVYSHLKDLGTRFGTAAAGATHEEQDQLARAAAADIPKALQAPVATMLEKFGLDLHSDPTAVAKVMGVMAQGVEKGGAWVEKETGGLVTKEAFQTLLEGQMAAMGSKATASSAKWAAKKIAGKEASKEAPKTEEPQPTTPETSPEPTPGTLFGNDAQINARKIAQKLVDEGAPLKTVLAARKRNPLVGKEIDDIMARRKDIREGPMANVRQGEVLPPEGPTSPSPEPMGPEDARARIARENPNPSDYHRVVEDHVQARIASAQIPLLTHQPELERRSTARQAIDLDKQFYKMTGETAATASTKMMGIGARNAKRAKGLLDSPMEESPYSPEALAVLDKYKEAFRQNKKFAAAGGVGQKQAGRADPKLLARIAAVGLGVSAGTALDPQNKLKGALFGAVGAAALINLRPHHVTDFYKKMIAPDTRIRVNDIADRREYTIEAARIMNNKMKRDIMKLVPSADRRIAITTWREGDKTIKLSSEEMKAAKLVDDFYKEMGKAGMDAEVLKNLRDNYVTHIWEWGTQTKSKIEEALSRRTGGQGMSPKSPYAKERTINTIKEGKALGLTPRTEDIAEILETYGNSMAQAIANTEFMKGLKAAKSLDGKSLLISAGDAPHTYVSVNHPQLAGMRVHPDIAPSLEFLFDNHPPSVAGRYLDAFNTALKRLSVSFSLFHNKALVDAFIGAKGITKRDLALTAGGAAVGYTAGGQNSKSALLGASAALLGSKAWQIKNFITGKDAFLQQLKNEGVGPLIDDALKGGLKFSLEKDMPGTEDVGGSFYNVMSDIQGILDKTVPGLGLPVKGISAINHAVDNLTWARMHTGLKLNIFAEKFEQIMQNNAKAHEANPDKVALMSRDEAAKIAASFSNDTFGGLNWRLVAEGFKTRWARDIALGMLKPSSRRWAQILMFAPDWTVSTVRAMTQAAGKGSGVKGLVSPRTLADLHRQYIIRSAAYYMLVGNALNMYFSGKPLWDNKDMTRIDLGDGRTMQWSKHTMEPIHWLKDPNQQALNKLGIFPRQVLEQAQKVEYLSATGKAPPMKGSRLGHLAHGILPISVQQNFDAGSTTGLAGLAGAPIYGKTNQQKMQEKLRKEMDKMSPEKIQERLENERKRMRGE